MAQLRQEYDQFVARDAEIIIVGPDRVAQFKRYWIKEQLPFVGLPDPDHIVARLYGQQVNWLKLGRLPSLLVIDKQGRVHYRHDAGAMHDIPSNESVLGWLDQLQENEQ